MGKIYITRHGETEWNNQGKMQGWNDSPLTDTGKKQAEWLYERIKDHKIDYVYSSPLGRAFETAKIINKGWNHEILTADELKEIYMGSWQGVEKEKIKEVYGDMFDIYWTRPHEYVSGDRESFEDVIQRAEGFLKRIVENHKDDNVLIVTHTVTIKSMLLNLEGKELSELWNEPFIRQTCLTILDHDGENIEIEMHADVSHHREDFVKNPLY